MLISKLIAAEGFEVKARMNSLIDPDGSMEDIEEMATLMARKIYPKINFIRTSVVPMLEKFDSYFTNEMSNIKSQNSTLTDIIVLKDYDLIDNLNDAGIIENISSGELSPSAISFPPVDADKVRDHYLAPSSDVNSDMEDILESKSTDELLKIWELYFGNFSKTNPQCNNLRYFAYKHIETIQLLYVLCRNFEDGLPETVVNGKDKARNDLIIIKEFLLSCMASYLRFLNTNKINENIITGIDIVDAIAKVYVMEDKYLEFLSNSQHGVDAIAGYVSTLTEDDNPILKYADLIENDFKYYDIEIRRIDATKVADIARNKISIETMYVNSATYIHQHISEKPELGSVTVDQIRAVIKKLLNLSDVSNVKIYKTKEMAYLIIGFLYPSIYEYLSSMISASLADDNILANDPSSKVTPGEAALHATMDTVVSAVLEQFQLAKVSNTYQG